MFSANRGGIPSLAAIAFSGLAFIASLPARCEVARPDYGRREPVHRGMRYVAPSYPVRSAIVGHAEIFHAAAVHATAVQQHVAPRSTGLAPPAVSPTAAPQALHAPVFANAPRKPAAQPMPPLSSHLLGGGNSVSAQRLFQAHVWHQFGHAIEYRTFAAAMQYPPVYYSWALATWPHPIAYPWGWQTQSWYPAYGTLFTPYTAYASPDLWMTDYILAQNMQAAYQGQPVTPSLPAVEPAPVSPTGVASPGIPGENLAQPTPGNVPLASPPAEPPPVPATAAPPAVTPAVKAQLDTQIKVQLQDRQAAAAMPATLTSETTPAVLRPNHVFFEVVQPLYVPSANAPGFCALKPNDYIRRTGGMSPDDWMIPVIVELSAPSDCPVGLHTQLGLNDLSAMESEQEVRVMEALQAASKSMGPNGPPNTPGAHPSLIADAAAAPGLSVSGAIQRAE